MVCLACEKELDFEYHEIPPVVVVEGRLTNEGTEVLLTRSRSVEDSVQGRGLAGAQVVVTGEGVHETLAFDAATGRYRSAFKGISGQTYRLAIDFEGQHFEGEATMPPPAPIISNKFVWMNVLDMRALTYVVWAADPQPSQRNYFWYRMDRRSHHPHLQGKRQDKAYRWNVFDDRGMPQNMIFAQMMCTSEKVMEDDKEEDWERIIYDGDSIFFYFMTIDEPTYEFYRSLRSGQSGGANPTSNLTGGCQGYFTAGSVTRADTVVFRRELVKEFERIKE